ncbi:MAG: GTP cyclohydrolase I FolE [Bacteroidia bacterium]|nr:GTP cyclohydrolase I FolE [Bacteroidia bacterium]MCX7763712.1 GTP cyclohydrolase I FolE [Bacteroidia bacterium]MDW8057612.1 GTP cyclohydrolase I FolE [Bacteroidia bacterium]
MAKHPEYTNGHEAICACGVEDGGAPLQEKETLIAYHFGEIMRLLGLDLNDPSLQDTPHRVAKMFVRELFIGLDPAKAPGVRLFPNTYGYRQMVVEKDIRVRSVCEHHFVPIIGVAHVAYIPREWVVGLSKLNRIVDYFARRPQVQERLTQQIADFLEAHLHTPDVAVVIDAKHYCVSMRGIQDEASRTLTYAFRGAFEAAETKDTFLRLVGL